MDDLKVKSVLGRVNHYLLHGDYPHLDKSEFNVVAQALQRCVAPEAQRKIPDFDGLCDNAAGASQSRELLDDKITRGAVKANIYDPLVDLLREPQRGSE